VGQVKWPTTTVGGVVTDRGPRSARMIDELIPATDKPRSFARHRPRGDSTTAALRHPPWARCVANRRRGLVSSACPWSAGIAGAGAPDRKATPSRCPVPAPRPPTTSDPCRIEVTGNRIRVAWSVHARGRRPSRSTRVGLVWELGHPATIPALRERLSVVGTDAHDASGRRPDPSRDPRPPAARARRVPRRPGRRPLGGTALGSTVTLLAWRRGSAAMRRIRRRASSNAGTLRVRHRRRQGGLCAEAWLGGARWCTPMPPTRPAPRRHRRGRRCVVPVGRVGPTVGATAGCSPAAPYVVGCPPGSVLPRRR